MEMINVDSTQIMRVGWTEAEGLRVEFVRGNAVWGYDAPRSAYEGIIGADSPGGYFSQNVKERFPGRRL